MRASFCVSKVGTIVSSGGIGLAETEGGGLDADFGANVWAGKSLCVARSTNKKVNRPANGKRNACPTNPEWRLGREINPQPAIRSPQFPVPICLKLPNLRSLNAAARTDALLPPAFGQCLPSRQFPLQSLCGDASRSRTFAVANFSGFGSPLGSHQECSHRCAFS